MFVEETLEHVNTIAEKVGLNFIQLHGNEPFKYCRELQLPVFKVFRVVPEFDSRIMKSYDVHAFLFDTYEKDKPGGTGKLCNWDIISDFHFDTPIILSGGLSIKNIKQGIDIVCPSAVDINSGVESKPGVKDGKKIKAIFDLLKNTTC